jgi:F0F1-type ATP synthase assembly protein I
MIAVAVAAFVGAFAALVALAEIQAASKPVRYFAAFVVGLVAAVLLGLLVGWIAGLMGQAG